uniref:Smr domain-containing protein n=1 Tax=Trichuris muris TaxID=70415 RepID=A0A5S6QRP2_TRIMR
MNSNPFGCPRLPPPFNPFKPPPMAVRANLCDNASWQAVRNRNGSRRGEPGQKRLSDVEKISNAIGCGCKVTVILRGVPGSGKTTLAMKLTQMNPDSVVCSADEYFKNSDGVYVFDPERLSDAHRFCLQRAVAAMESKVSLIIIDNTNTMRWEMKRYVTSAYRHGYKIFFLEPQTPWKFDAYECASRTVHGVSLSSIQRMISSFEHGVTLADFLEGQIIRPPASYGAPDRRFQRFQRPMMPRSFFAPTLNAAGLFSCGQAGHVASACSPPKETSSNSQKADLVVASSDADPRTLSTNSEQAFPNNECSVWHDAGAGAEQYADPSSTVGCMEDQQESEEGNNKERFLVTDELLPNIREVKLSQLPWSDNLDQFDFPEETIAVADVAIQTCEQFIALSTSAHPRVMNADEPEQFHRGECRTTVVRRFISRIDQSTTADEKESDSDNGSWAVLRDCFPTIMEDDLAHIFESCGRDLQWAINVLLDSGYDYNWRPFRPASEAEEAKTEMKAEESAESEDASSGTEGSAEESSCVMELSPDMAMQLQQMFGFFYRDIPPDLLDSSQLKIRIPMELAFTLYTSWIATQTAEVCGSLEEQCIMDGVLARSLAEEEDESQVKVDPRALSSRLKLQSLLKMFPSIDPDFLENLFHSNGCVLGATIDSVCKKFKLPKPELNNVINLKESSEEESAGRSNAANSEEDDVPTYVSLRAEALHHKSEREYNFKKAQDAYRTGMKSVAYHYAQQAHLHDRKCKDANRQAANAILEYRRSLHPPTTVDLHGLYVPEALAAVSELLSNAGPKQTLKVITGKGTHSSDGPKIGPAVVKYLTQKKLEFSESTPGVILVKT